MTARASKFLFLAVAAAIASTFPASAALTLGGPLSDHMVVQAGRPFVVWGSADPSSKVSVSFDGKSADAVSQADGSWRVTLPPSDYADGHKPQTLTVRSGSAEVSVTDVLIGEVWLCSGQSNMRYTLGRHEAPADTASPLIFPTELAAAGNPAIRLLNVSAGANTTPAGRRWAECSPESVAGFSAIGYFFGRHLQEKRHVPVGLIDLGKGGQSIKAFLPEELIASDPRLEKLRGGNPDKPAGVVFDNDLRWLAPFSVRGVLWYQGESDVTRASAYAGFLDALVETWRATLENSSLPFLIVQLPGFAGKSEGESDTKAQSFRPALCEAQEKFVKNKPGTALAVTIDLGEKNEIHPRRKQAVGDRLALLARSFVYGEKVPCSGPQPRSAAKQGSKMLLRFDHADGGLVVRGNRLTAFSVAGEDGKFAPAEAAIVPPDGVLVSGRAPVKYVRYGWMSFFEPTLFNANGLPARPFRTDNLSDNRSLPLIDP